MRLEIVSAADFLVQLLRLQSGSLTEGQLQQFKGSLTDVLRLRYRDHWFPDKPNRGSGYRCIRINGKMDPVIAQAGAKVGLLPTLLHGLFPSELTMWIDPSEVSYRIGENGSICVLFEGSTRGEDLGSSTLTVQADYHQTNNTTTSPTNNNNNNNNHNNNGKSNNSSSAAVARNQSPPSTKHIHHLSPQRHHQSRRYITLSQPAHVNNNQHHSNKSHLNNANNVHNSHHQHMMHHHQQLQQQYESCKDSLLLEHQQFNEQIAGFVSS